MRLPKLCRWGWFTVGAVLGVGLVLLFPNLTREAIRQLDVGRLRRRGL